MNRGVSVGSIYDDLRFLDIPVLPVMDSLAINLRNLPQVAWEKTKDLKA